MACCIRLSHYSAPQGTQLARGGGLQSLSSAKGTRPVSQALTLHWGHSCPTATSLEGCSLAPSGMGDARSTTASVGQCVDACNPREAAQGEQVMAGSQELGHVGLSLNRA